MTTPSPRPAALVAAETVRRLCGPVGATDVANAIIRDLAASDHVLIPRAELEEAADKLEQFNSGIIPKARGYFAALSALIDRLRQRSRG